jgi:hypothetical protein
MFAPGSLSVPAGFAVSRCHVQVAGEASVLPAGSVARTSNVWELSVSPATPFGLAQGVQLPPSMRHSKVDPLSEELKVKLGVVAFDGSAGSAVIVVSGAVRSTSTLRMSLEAWPALSVATAASAWFPSVAGMFHDTLYGPGAGTVPSGLQTPVEQSLLWFEHSKNCTCVTPLPPGSPAVAEKLVGLGSEPLIAAAGAVIAADGGTLSTRMLVFSTVVVFAASSVARARRS